ncbi:EKA-like protein [Blumeria hordei DH14]|uniref:EKA-like protein n=1 Tax=Blumeria graminis f. sp. hordei (strain DH14) TaxID=546991 RepID=N1JDK2_BLUG1|nr:EKA-like protein [Blumeria hordei DH14]
MSQLKVATKEECPPELQPILEAEERHTAKIVGNLGLYSAANSGFEATLLPLIYRSNRQFVDSRSVYLRAIIAQFMASGPTPTSLVLLPRPTNPPPRAPDARSPIKPVFTVLPVKSIWSTVANS